jgi:hypothetical protein
MPAQMSGVGKLEIAKMLCSSIMFMIIKVVIQNVQKPTKMQAIDSKSFNHATARHCQKTRGGKMQASVIMLLKTNGSKMSESSLAIFLLKTLDL